MIIAAPLDFATYAFWLTLPFAVWAAWDDVTNLTIRNTCVFAMLLVFLGVAVATLPVMVILWKLGLGVTVLAITFVLFQLGILGGGDAKYIAVIAPFFWWNDWNIIAPLFVVVLLGTLVLHNCIKLVGTGHWATRIKSLAKGTDFPLGLPLGLTLVCYLAMAAQIIG